MLYALRGAKKLNKPCPAELHYNRKFTTVKDIITTKPNKNYNVLDNDNNFQLENRIPKSCYEKELEAQNLMDS